MGAIEDKIRELPIRKLKLDPTSLLGSYVDSAIEMVRLDESLQIVKDLLNEPELRGLMGLLDKFRQQMENEIKSLPIKRFKIDPFSHYHKSASLFIEEEYIELNDIIKIIHQYQKSFEEVISFIIEFLCQLVKWKEERLSESYLEYFRGDAMALADLKGKKEEVEKALAIRARAIAQLQEKKSVDNLSVRAKTLIEEVVSKMTSATWWLKNSHRTSFAILLQINNMLDEALLAEFSGLSDSRSRSN